MTRAGTVLVTGATGRVGRLVVDELLRAGVSVRALTSRPEKAALPAGVEVVVGDLTVPASLDAALDGAETVFLVWTAAAATVGSPARTFYQWAADNAAAFADPGLATTRPRANNQ